jgi:hypothetical protein
LNPYRPLVENPKGNEQLGKPRHRNDNNINIYLRGIFGSGIDWILLKVLENRVLRRIFGPKRDEVTGEWRKLHNEEPPDLYSSPSIIRIIKSRRMGWAGHAARMGEKRIACRLLVGKPKGKRPLRRPRRR